VVKLTLWFQSQRLSLLFRILCFISCSILPSFVTKLPTYKNKLDLIFINENQTLRWDLWFGDHHTKGFFKYYLFLNLYCHFLAPPRPTTTAICILNLPSTSYHPHNAAYSDFFHQQKFLHDALGGIRYCLHVSKLKKFGDVTHLATFSILIFLPEFFLWILIIVIDADCF